jgi:DNA polymerase III epsilon subunit-like protein
VCYKSPGPRCSNHAKKELDKARSGFTIALRSGDEEKAFVAKCELEKAQNDFYMTPKGQAELIEEIEKTGDPDGDLQYKLEYGQTARKAAIKAAKVVDKGDVNVEHPEEETGPVLPEHLQNADFETLEKALDERVNTPEFIALIAERDRTRAERKALQDEIKAQKDKLESLEKVAEGKIPAPKQPKPTPEEVLAAQDALDEEYEKMRELNDKHLDAFYAYHVANGELEEYKNETALVVARMNDLAGDPGVPYEASTLGNCVEVASYDSGTREWLEERQNGIGGSDVGSILKLDPEFGQSNFNDFVKSKTEPYSAEEVAAQAEANSGFSGPTGRGNAWETAIVRQYIAENPNQTVMYSKASWANEENRHHKANVDGLLSSDGVTPDGILEIKTASDIEHWEHKREDGTIEERVPLGYRAQVLWYLRQTGFSYADIAVKVDDREYRSRRIYANEAINPYDTDDEGNPAVGTLDENMPTIERVWKEEVVARRDGTRPVRNLKSDFEKAADADNIHNQSVQLAAWRQIPISEAKSIIKGHRAAYMKGMRGSVDGSDVPTLTDRIKDEYRKGGPTTWKKDLVSVDIETSGMGPNSGEIIEIGIRRTRPDGTIVTEYEERFGVKDERILNIIGTGAQDVHKITPDDIRGKRRFTHPEVQEKVKALLMDDDVVVVAHNKAFEERWFDQYIPGFRKHRARLTTSRFKAERAGVPHPEPKAIMCTMFQARYLNHDSANNRLATYSESNGVPYLNAHSALPDAQMTQEAIWNFDKKLRGLPFVDRTKKGTKVRK